MAAPIKRIEVYLGGSWQAWVSSDIVSIKKGARIVTIVTNHPEHGVYTTYIDLDLVPAYTLA